MTKAFEYKGYRRCEQCMKNALREKGIRDDNEIRWIFYGCDQLSGKMDKWPVRDADGDYVKVNLRRLRASLAELIAPEVVYNLHMGVQVYYEDWRPRNNDPAVEINEDIEQLEEEDYEDDGLDCESCEKRIWGPRPLYCIRDDCMDVLTEGAKNIEDLQDAYLFNEQLCETHYCDLMLHIEGPVIMEISARNRETPSKDFEDFLDRIAENDLHMVFRHFFGLITVHDEIEQTPRFLIVESIQRLARRFAHHKPFEIVDFSIVKEAAFEFAPPD